jgi:transposase
MDVPPSVRELILSHHVSGHSCRQIATMVNVSKSTVIRLVKRYKDTGSIEEIRIGNCGRLLLLSQRDERALARQSVADPSQTAREIQSSVRGNTTRASISTYGKGLLTQLI